MRTTSIGPRTSTPTTLGLPLIARFGPLVFIDLGGTRLLLEEAAPPAMIYLLVDDLTARVDRAAGSGVDVVAEPHDIFTDTEGVFGGAWRVESRPSSGIPRATWSAWFAPPLSGSTTVHQPRRARIGRQCTVASR